MPEQFKNKEGGEAISEKNEQNTSNSKQEAQMANQEMVNEVRSLLIESLEESIGIYTKDGTQRWVNEDNCRELITHLLDKTPTKMGGPFWGDLLDGILHDKGFHSPAQEYEEIRRQIEEGK